MHPALYRKVVTDTTGRYWFDPDSLAHTYTYNGSSLILTDTVNDGVNTYVKTYGYTGSNLTSESGWVKQ
jgi:hypothetical protein